MFSFNSVRLYLSFFLIQCFLFGCALFEKEFILPLPIATDATQINAVKLTANWNKVTGASSYEIDVALDKEFTLFVRNFQDKKVYNNSIVVDGLESNTTYYYRIRANISNQTSKNSNVIEVVTEALDVPIAYPATEVSSTGFRIHWKKMPIVTMYEVDVALDETFNQTLDGYKALEVAAQDTTLLISNLTVNKQYFYRVRVKQSDSFSEYSNIQSVFTSSLPRPAILPATKVQLTSFMANWVAMAEAESYRVDVAKDALFRQILTGYKDLSVNNNSLIVLNLNANTEYFYRVRAVNGKARSNYSEVMTVLTSNLKAPVATAATSIESGSFQVNWNPVTDAASYLLDVALDQNFTQVLPGYNGFPVIDNFLTIPSLDAETQYFYRVRSKGLNAISNYSNTIQVTTGQLPAPIATAATAIKVFEFTANWQLQTGINVYLLDVATDPGFTNFVAGYQNKEIVGTLLKVTGLDFTTTYYYRLRSKRLTKTSGYSNTIQVVPCISETCKMTSVELFTNGVKQNFSQTFVYDTQNRLSEIKYSDNLKYVVNYNANGTIRNVVYLSNGSIFYDYIYAYNSNNLVESIQKNGSTGSFVELWRFDYNAKNQRTTWNIYADFAGATLRSQYNYTYDSRGNVTEIKDQSNTLIKSYAYDNKLSAYALFRQVDLCFFIAVNRDQWTNDGSGNTFNNEWRGFLPFNNIIKEVLTGASSEVFIFQSNKKDVSTAQDAYLSAKYTFAGCSF